MPDSPTTRPSLLVRLRDPQDALAWGQFVDLYAPLVYGYARKRGLQDADAQKHEQKDVRPCFGLARDRFDGFCGYGSITHGRPECHARNDDAETDQRRGCD